MMRGSALALALLSLVFCGREAYGQAAELEKTGNALPISVQPRIQVSSTGIQYTPAEWRHGAYLLELQALSNVPSDRDKLPSDSIANLVREHVRAWLPSVRAEDRDGIQSDAYASLMLAAHGDSAARRILDARLASPQVTEMDRAVTLLNAVIAFSDVNHPERFPIAEQYMAQLDKMPVKTAAYWRTSGHSILASAYVTLDNRPAQVAHYLQMTRLLKDVFIGFRPGFFNRNTYVALAFNLADVANGADQLKAVNQLWIDAIKMPPELNRNDYIELADNLMYAENAVKNAIAMAASLNQPAPLAIYAQGWVNVPDGASHEEQLNDGTFRILGIGSRTWGYPIIPALERVQQKMGGRVRALYLVNSSGFWGRRFVTPAEEVDSLRAYYTRAGLKLPIGFLVPEKRMTREGGWVPGESAIANSFQAAGSPRIVIIDGHGIIRYMLPMLSRNDEALAASILTQLMSNAHNAP